MIWRVVLGVYDGYFKTLGVKNVCKLKHGVNMTLESENVIIKIQHVAVVIIENFPTLR
ncbi:hypothetical protein M8C21_006490 [Ambrosia artemisiifolia]|uniref:Uncharacterized protein n=1 Tax=Ambrosia artemisiifolia TaxID=4212 RepID=A0AAD5GII8_AMBAR|nr:hypothetical protein M8C21_006490 [Ambrosia artemisiifolia]